MTVAKSYSCVTQHAALFIKTTFSPTLKCQALDQLRQFGFEDGKIKAALVASGSDTDKALDQLMVT